VSDPADADAIRRHLQQVFGERIASVDAQEAQAFEITWPALSLNVARRVLARRAPSMCPATPRLTEMLTAYFGQFARFVSGVLTVRSASCLVECGVWCYSHLISRGVQPSFFADAHRAWAEVLRGQSVRRADGLADLCEELCNQHENLLAISSCSVPRTRLEEPFRSYVRSLSRALRSGDLPRAERLAESSLARLHAAGELPLWWDRVVAPILRTVGQLWEIGRIEAPQEAIVTAIVQRLIDRSFPTLPLPDGRAPTLVAVPSGECHDLGARLVRDLLTTFGYPTVLVSGQVERRFLLTAVEGMDRVFLSATLVSAMPAMREMIDEIRRASDAEIVVGGRVFATDPDAAGSIGADRLVPDLQSLVSLLPFSPKRGDVLAS
jgi:methanogenic corrinoid protein MtbC1